MDDPDHMGNDWLGDFLREQAATDWIAYGDPLSHHGTYQGSRRGLDVLCIYIRQQRPPRPGPVWFKFPMA
jgi:hypothetical protein